MNTTSRHMTLPLAAKPQLRPAARPSRLRYLPASLLGAGCLFWALFWAIFNPYDGSVWGLVSLIPCALAILCPLLALLLAIVALVTGDERGRNAVMLGCCLLLPIVYMLIVSVVG